MPAYFGGEDYIADMGGRRTRRGDEILFARSQVAIACRLSGVAAIDTVVLGFDSRDEFNEDSQVGRDLGYSGKMCIHPAQVPWAKDLFTPSREEVERALRLLAAYEDATARGLGTLKFEGQMVDTPLVLQAQRIVTMAD
ncbi:HpcH/HpaI aldolase/citrate lyase family protein [Yinghuangia aomiensis]